MWYQALGLVEPAAVGYDGEHSLRDPAAYPCGSSWPEWLTATNARPSLGVDEVPEPAGDRAEQPVPHGQRGGLGP
jgi:hypothetical protein